MELNKTGSKLDPNEEEDIGLEDSLELQQEDNKNNNEVNPDDWESIGSEELPIIISQAKPLSKINLDENILDKPYKIFCHFFTDELFEFVANETNRYFLQTIKNSKINER